jgi:enoyl-CoA hydratase/carnithine racemase
MNAINTEVGLTLNRMFSELASEPTVRVIVLTGAGEAAFSAGGDLKERNGMTPTDWTNQHRIFESVHHLVRELRKPIFAAVNGVAVGGGLELALCTDFIIASDNARFGQPEVKRGIIPGGGGTQFLPRFLPRGIALQLLMTGRLISADEAFRWGLVNQVYPPGQLMPAAEALAAEIADNSPAAVQLAKRAAKLGLDQPIEQAIATELECYQQMVDHADRYEGVAAFNERRQPNFADVS